MNKNFLSSLILAGALTVGSLNAQTFGGGNGSYSNPWQINIKSHLQELDNVMQQSPNNWTWGKYFRLMNDITDSVNFVIGHAQLSFRGYFYGGGKKITLAINNTTSAYNSNFIALFRQFSNTGRIDSLKVDGYVTTTIGQAAGIVCLISNGMTNNCINNATITNNSIIGSANGYAAGIAANVNIGAITNCTNNGNTTSYYQAAGIVANIRRGVVMHCVNNGKILVTADINGNVGGGYDIPPTQRIGGIGAVVSDNSTILKCANLGKVECYNNQSNIYIRTFVGGIIGDVGGDSVEIIENINYGFVKTDVILSHTSSAVGGIVGMAGGNSNPYMMNDIREL